MNEISNKSDTAVLGAGCFWCIEAIFLQVDGVDEVISGYTGGHIKNPTYKEICTGTTGHAEVCKVVYDSTKVDFDTLLKIFCSTGKCRI